MGTIARRLRSAATFVFLVSGLSCQTLFSAESDEEFEAFQQSFQSGIEDSSQSLQNEFAASIQEDERLIAQEEKEYTNFKKEIEKQWDEFKGSTKKEWVDYGENNSSRSIVDFEKGNVTLEVVVPVDANQKPSSKLSREQRLIALNKLKKQLKKIIDDNSIGGESPVHNQISTDNKKPITRTNINRIAENIIDQKLAVTPTAFVAKDGKPRRKASVTLKMLPNHLQIRAGKFAQPVKKYSRKYNLDPALVFAIIHTESYFNPKARSHIPAYGLMQLVPSSGARDAYRHAFGKDKKPSASYLYDASNNIQLGTAYLDLLSKREFKNVNNKTSKMYLIVAAYNTGGGNVSKALNGTTNIYKASDKINRMSPDKLYQTLERKLPYKETRDYIKKVRERKTIYDGY